MNKRIKELFRSLVGANWEFRTKGEVIPCETFEGDVEQIRKVFSLFEKSKFKASWSIACIAEMWSYYYYKTTYYMAVRKHFEFGRYRKAALEFLKKTPDAQQEVLLKNLNEYADDARELFISGAVYFLKVYPSRKIDFLSQVGSKDVKYEIKSRL